MSRQCGLATDIGGTVVLITWVRIRGKVQPNNFLCSAGRSKTFRRQNMSLGKRLPPRHVLFDLHTYREERRKGKAGPGENSNFRSESICIGHDRPT